MFKRRKDKEQITYPHRKVRRGLWLRFSIASFFIICATTATTSAIGILSIEELIPGESSKIPGVRKFLKKTKPGEPQIILLLGSDRRLKDKKLGIRPRSDTMMLVRLDPKTRITTLLSLPRDLRVDIPTKNGLVTDKLNAAYSEGGVNLTIKTIQKLLHININHVVNVTFGGFQSSVNIFNGFYVDVDRRYFNDNNPPVASPTDYATIDIQPGYQRLVGSDSLDYVRFRHLDTDLVRSKRQQDYLSSVKQQVAPDYIIDNRKRLAKALGKYTETDIQSSQSVVRILRLVYEAAQGTMHEVKFIGSFDKQFVVTTPDSLKAMRNELLHPKLPKKSRKKATEKTEKFADHKRN